MKRRRLSTARLCFPLASAFAVLLAAPRTQAISLWWDTNGTTTANAAATGTWLAGSTSNWTTASAGNLATTARTTTNDDDLFFAATGMTAATITLNTIEAARSVNFSANQAFVISGTGTINLGSATGTSGIFNTVAAAQSISTSVVLNPGATAIAISNISTAATSSLMTLGGTITGSATSGTQMISARATHTGGITVSNAISDGLGGGKVALTVNSSGPGITTLSGTNTYTGNTRVDSGILQLTNRASLYNDGMAAIWTKNNIIVGNGAALVFNVGGGTQFTKANIVDLLNLSDSATNGFMSGSRVGIDTSGGSLLYDSIISNTNGGNNVLGLIKLGGNTLTLDQNNTYTGNTLISAGILQIGNGSTTGKLSTSSSILNNGTFTINRSNAVVQGTDFSAAPIIGTGALIQAGAGTTTLNAANTFTGSTTVTGGVLALTNPLALQNSAYDTTGSNGTTIGMDVTNALTAGNLTLGGLSGAVDLAGAFTAGFTGSVTNLTLNPQGAQSNTYSSIIANGAMSLTKTGTGTQILAGANAYTGATTIREGTLTVGNGLTGSLNGTTGTALSFTGTGTFNVAEAAGSTQGMGALTLSAGDASVTSTAAGATSIATLTFASLAARPAGTTANFTPATNTTSTGATPNRIVISGTNIIPLASGSNNPGLFFGGINYARYDAAGFVRAVTYGTDTNAPAALSGTAVANLGATTVVTDTQFTGATRATTTSGAVSGTQTNTLAVTNGALFSVGQILTGTNIAANTYITGISGNTLTLANAGGINAIGGSAVAAATVLTPYNSVTGQTAASVNTLNLSGTGASLTLVSGATLSVNGILRSGALTSGVISGGAGIQTVGSGGELVIRTNLAGDVLTVASPILDNGGSSLTKSGAGTLLLSAANTYTGGTVLNGGTVVISNANSLGATTGPVTVNASSRINAVGGVTYANPITVNAGQTLTMQNPRITATTAELSGVLSGSGNLSLANAGTNGVVGTLHFSNAANTFTGNVILSSTGSGDENFQFNSLGDAGNFTFAKNGNRQLMTYAGSSNLTFNTRQIVIAETMFNGGTTDRQGMDGGGSNPVSMFANDGAGTISFTQNMVVNNITNSYGVLYFGGTNAGDNTFSGNISDTIGTSKLAIGKFGIGKWILSGTNTFEGNILIGGGTLSVGTIANATIPQPLGIGPAIQLGVGSSGANGALLYTGGTTGTDKQVQIGATTANGSTGGGSILNDGIGALTFTNPIFNPATTGVTGTRTLTLGGSYTGAASEVQGVIQNNAAAGLVGLAKSGAGTWVLSGANTFTGGVTINDGTLRLGNAGALNSTAGSENAVTFGASAPGTANLTLNGNSVVIRSLATNATPGSPVVQNASATPVTLTVGNSLNLSTTYAGTIQDGLGGGALALTKAGTGTLTLSGANSHTGLTTVNAGVVVVQNDSALGSAAGATSVASGARVVLGGGITVTGEDLTISGNGGNFFGALQGSTGTSKWTGNVLIDATDTRIGTATGAGLTSLEISGVIDDGAADHRLLIRNQGDGTVILSGNNTWTGAAHIGAGTAQVTSLNKVTGGSASSSLGAPTTAANGTIILGVGALSGSMRYVGAGETTDRSVQVGFYSAIPVVGDTGGSSILNDGTGGALSFSAPVFNTPDNNILNAVSPARTLTLGGANTADNTITGEIGNNQVAGSPTAPVNLAKTGSGTWLLGGTSTYTGTTTVSAGRLLVNGQLGNTAVSVTGTGTIGGSGVLLSTLSFAATSFLEVNLADPLQVDGTITFGSGFGISNITGFDWDSVALDSPLTLLSTTQVFTSAEIANFGLENAAPVGSLGRSAYFQNGSLAAVVVPETSAVSLLGLATLLTLRRRRTA